jgi:hypothetical protein
MSHRKRNLVEYPPDFKERVKVADQKRLSMYRVATIVIVLAVVLALLLGGVVLSELG